MRPRIMGVINLDPHSFHSANRHLDLNSALEHAFAMIEEGADILDLGAESTHPFVENPGVSPELQLQRLLPLIAAIREKSDITLSIDTQHPEVMQATIEAGANMINDVSALCQPGALETAASLSVPVILMHRQHTDSPQSAVFSSDEKEKKTIDQVVKKFLQERIDACLAAGIQPRHIILDPGFGGGYFGKSTEENLTLLRRLNDLKTLNYPILAGVSRKIFVGDILKKTAENRLYGSLALAFYLFEQGVDILRTHDVAATIDVLKVYEAVFFSP